MKKFLLLLMMPLMLGALAACSDDSEVIGEPENLKTRTEDPIPSDYYWSGGKKHSLKLSDSESFILFHENDKEIVLSKLKELGVTSEQIKVTPYGILPNNFSIPNDNLYQFSDALKATIPLNYMKAKEIDELIYAGPCILYLNVLILGKLQGLADSVYLVACTNSSKGHTLDIANAFFESGLFKGAEPSFIAAQLAGGVE